MDLREQAFVHEYIINGGNAYQAALKAGYTKNTARCASEWLQETLKNSDKRHLPYKPELAAAIQEEHKKIQSEKIADETEIREYLTKVMRREETDYVVMMAHEEYTKYVPDPETGRKVKQMVRREVPKTVEVPSKISDANKAAELLGKTMLLFTDRLDLSADMDLNINIDYGGDDT